ncbi:MAG: hypothetical protein V4638_00860 [Bacteroidota bacterium]
MKKGLLSIFGLVATMTLSAQTLQTGDSKLDADLKEINVAAKKDLTSFKANLATTYSSSKDQVNAFFAAGMEPSDVVISYEIMNIAQKKPEDVIRVFKADKSKGWGEMAKELGIKPGSAEFHKLKEATGKKNPKAKGKSKGKAKGKSDDKGTAKPASTDSTPTGADAKPESKGKSEGKGKK